LPPLLKKTFTKSFPKLGSFEEWQSRTSSSQCISPFSFHRIHLKGYSGTAGKISSLGQPGSDFSTKDADNDKCVCKCSQLTTGGKEQVHLQITLQFSLAFIKKINYSLHYSHHLTPLQAWVLLPEICKKVKRPLAFSFCRGVKVLEQN
jgi:hypothetical protein